MRSQARLRLIAILLGLCAALLRPGAARADGSATFGTQWWEQSAPEAKFQEFRDVPNGMFMESFFVRGGDNQWASAFYGRNALHKDQLLGLRIDRGIRWQLDGTYKQIPHNISQIAQTSFTQVSPGVFLLPDSLQRTNQENPGAYVPTMTDLLNTAPRVAASFRTDEFKGRLRSRPKAGLQFEFTGMERNRNGQKPYGTSLGFNSAIELLEPIDQRVWDGSAKASYAKGKMSARALIGYSAFENSVDVLRWDNPKRITDRTYPNAYVAGDGSNSGLIDLYPDNQALRGAVGFVYRLSHQSTFTADLGVSRLTQDDSWQKFTVNTAIPDSVLNTLYTTPDRSTDAKAIRFNQDYRLSGKVASNFRGAVRFHQNHYDNQTPVHEFRGAVRVDQVLEPGTTVGDSLFITKPFGNDQKTAGADLNFGQERVQVSGTFEYRMREHTEREVEKDNETYTKLTTWFEATDDLHFDLSAYQGIRVQEEFLSEDYRKGENTDSAFVELQGMRRYDVANRHQKGVDANLDLALGDEIDLGVLFEHQQNDYPETVYGLTYLESNNAFAQATIHASAKLDLSGGFGMQRAWSKQRSNESNANPPPTPDALTDWNALVTDVNQYAFADVTYQASRPLHFTLGYLYSRDQASYDLSNGAGTAQDLPDTFYRRNRATFEANYRLKGGMQLGARYGLDYWSVEDFASQGIPLLSVTAGAATAIYLGDNSLDYHAHQAAVVVTRNF